MGQKQTRNPNRKHRDSSDKRELEIGATLLQLGSSHGLDEGGVTQGKDKSPLPKEEDKMREREGAPGRMDGGIIA